MAISDEDLGKLIQGIATQMHALEIAQAKLATGLLAVKAVVALQMEPNAPTHALKRIQALEEMLAKLDPNAAARKQVSDTLEVLELWDKHGGPKQA